MLKTGKTVAVVGSGLAGLAVAARLAEVGHTVTVFERDPYPGGLLRYSVPDFKLEKWVVERRIALLEAAGITFRCGVAIGRDLPADTLRRDFDAVVLAGGAAAPRELDLLGRELAGIHYAMDYLTQQNRRLSATAFAGTAIVAKELDVVAISSGDTGSDCVGTANRQGARLVTQLALMSQPGSERSAHTHWPLYR